MPPGPNQRTEGATYAVFSCDRKMGQTLGGSLGGWALVWAGFNAQEVAAGAAVAPQIGSNIGCGCVP